MITENGKGIAKIKHKHDLTKDHCPGIFKFQNSYFLKCMFNLDDYKKSVLEKTSMFLNYLFVSKLLKKNKNIKCVSILSEDFIIGGGGKFKKYKENLLKLLGIDEINCDSHLFIINKIRDIEDEEYKEYNEKEEECIINNFKKKFNIRDNENKIIALFNDDITEKSKRNKKEDILTKITNLSCIKCRNSTNTQKSYQSLYFEYLVYHLKNILLYDNEIVQYVNIDFMDQLFLFNYYNIDPIKIDYIKLKKKK